MRINKKELIISLIKDNLRNTHLVEGMNKLWSDSDRYHLYLNDTIFQLMGFKEDEQEEKAFERYLIACMKAASIDIFKHPKKLEAMANRIYENLVKEQTLQNSKNKWIVKAQKKRN